MTGVGEGDGVGVGEADGAGEGVADGVGTGEGVGTGDAVGVGDAVGLALGVGVGLELALLPALAALEEPPPPPHPTAANNMHARTVRARYLNIRHLFRTREIRCSRVPAGCLATQRPRPSHFRWVFRPHSANVLLKVLILLLANCQALIGKGWVFRGGCWYTAQCTISPLTHGF